MNAGIKFGEFCQFVLKIFSETKFWHKSAITLVQMCPKMTCNNAKLDLVNMNPYKKFGEILSNGFQDIERKRNFGLHQGP